MGSLGFQHLPLTG